MHAFLRRCVILIGLDLQLADTTHGGVGIGVESRKLCHAELCFEADLEGCFRDHGERLCLEITDEPEAVASAHAHAELLVPALHAAERAAQLHVIRDLEAADAGNAPVDKRDIVDVADAAGRNIVTFDLVGHVQIIRQLHVGHTFCKADFIGNRDVLDLAIHRERHRVAKFQFLFAAQGNAFGRNASSGLCRRKAFDCRKRFFISPVFLFRSFYVIGKLRSVIGFCLPQIADNRALRVDARKDCLIIGKRRGDDGDAAALRDTACNIGNRNLIEVHDENIALCDRHGAVRNADAGIIRSDDLRAIRNLNNIRGKGIRVFVVVGQLKFFQQLCGICQHSRRLCRGNVLLWQDLSV